MPGRSVFTGMSNAFLTALNVKPGRRTSQRKKADRPIKYREEPVGVKKSSTRRNKPKKGVRRVIDSLAMRQPPDPTAPTAVVQAPPTQLGRYTKVKDDKDQVLADALAALFGDKMRIVGVAKGKSRKLRKGRKSRKGRKQRKSRKLRKGRKSRKQRKGKKGRKSRRRRTRSNRRR